MIAILRAACRVLGLKRRNALGMPGFAAAAALALSIGPTQQANAAGSGDGIFINPGSTSSCIIISMVAVVPSTLLRSNSADCSPATKSSQTDHVLFYNPVSNSSNSLSLGGELYVNGGFIGLNNPAMFRGQILNSMAIGNQKTKAAGKDAIAVGNGAQSTSGDNIAIGRDSQAGYIAAAGSSMETDIPDADLRAIAIGAGTKALEQDTIAIGYRALAEDNMFGAAAIGANAEVHMLGGVALGFKSVTGATAVSTANVTINGAQYNFAGDQAYSQVSIGNATQKRQLTNMAAGQITAASTDGVNGSQLFATNSALGTLGGRVTVNETNISTNSSAINNITNGKTGLVQQSAGGENITVAAKLDGAAIDIAGTTAGKKGPRRLINLADGTDNTDAVNVGQLKTVDSKVTGHETRITTNEGAITNINTSITGLKNDALLWDSSVQAFSAKHGAETTSRIANVKAGTEDTDAVNVGQLKGLADAGTEAVKNLGDVAVKYVWDDKNGNGELDAGEVVDYGKVKLAGAGANGTVISNLGNGAVNATSREAINGSQIFGIAAAFGGGAGWNADGIFTGPTYKITVINPDRTLGSKDHDNVGDALGGLDNSVRIVNAKTDNVTDRLNALGSDALIWDESKKAFTASHADATSKAVSGNNRITDLHPRPDRSFPIPVTASSRPR
jgi:autotransporter adhesin